MQVNNTSTTAANPTGAAAAAGAAGTTASSVTLGGTDFLKLMLAQLKNQDPTSPVDSNAFLTQLAQLSQVQGITALNTSFTGLASSLTSSQALQASSLLGHQALVASGTASLAGGGTVSGAVAVPQTSSQVLVNVSNSAGVLVKQINLGPQAAGIASFTWDGTGADGSKAPAGEYKIAAQVNGVAAGTAVPTYINGTVQSVTMGGGSAGLSLNVGGLGIVPFANVVQISN